MIAAANWGLFPGYTVIGITLGGIYALAAIGLVLIYRVSGVLELRAGRGPMFSAFVAYQVSTVMGAPAGRAARGNRRRRRDRLRHRALHDSPPRRTLGAEQGRGDDRLAARPADGGGIDLGADGVPRPVQLASIRGFTFPGTTVVVGWDEFTTIVVALGLAFGRRPCCGGRPSAPRCARLPTTPDAALGCGGSTSTASWRSRGSPGRRWARSPAS